MIENRGFQYVLYFTTLVVIGSTGFYIIGIIDNEGNFNLNPGPNDILGSDSKVIFIGSNDQLTHFEENAINDL